MDKKNTTANTTTKPIDMPIIDNAKAIEISDFSDVGKDWKILPNGEVVRGE